jgi:Dolichyl-phosphate-mannose-protein mannosyltransferase
MAAALAAALFALNWFQPANFPDTGSYVLAAQSANPWGEVRHPLYGWLLMLLERAGGGQTLVPAIQYGVHVVAVSALYAACRSAGMERSAALALGLAAILSQCLVIWGRAVLPEMLSVSLLLAAMAAVIAAAQQRWFLLLAVVYGAAVGLSYTLRPIVLPAVLILPVIYLLFSRIVTREWWIARMLLLALIGFAPFFAQATYRWQTVGDFGLVSFGGFGISGMTVQMLTPDVVERLPEQHRPLAIQMLEAKDKAIVEQTAMPLFRNSEGQRSYQSTALDGFDTFARNYDEIMWGKLMALKGADESWVSFNARMGAVNGAILRAMPERWALWAAGAMSRLAGRLLTFNVAFLIASLVLGLVALVNIARTGMALGGSIGESWTMLTLIVLAWIKSTSALAVVATFPALRYADTAGMLLTALPLYGLFLALRKTNAEAPA